jgi:nucleoside-diphosphate-sugar epimerase
MRVLILGCGYVGLPLGEELVRQGHEVFGLRRSASAAGKLDAVGIRPLISDITRHEQLDRLPRQCDWIINLISSTGGGPEEYRQAYFEGTRNVIDWLAAAPPRKYVYTSSTGVYAQNDGSPVDETSRTEPGNETGKVLVETERLLIESFRQKHFPAVILRVAGIYGPGRTYFLKQFLSGESRIAGKGERVMNMIHLDDLVGIISAALVSGRPGEIYNAVDDQPVQQLDFYRWLAETLDRDMPPASTGEEQARKRGLTSKQVLNRKLKEELGYKFKHPTFRHGYRPEILQIDRGGAV